MSEVRISSQPTITTKSYLSRKCKLTVFYAGNCLALTTIFVTVTNCGSEDAQVDASPVETATAALRRTVDPDANNPATVVEDSVHAFSWTPATPATYGGFSTPASARMYAVGDANAGVQVGTSGCSNLGQGGWKTFSNPGSSAAALCTAQAQAEAARLAATEPDAPAACYVGTGTIESISCGKSQRVCTSTYGGGSDCRDVPITTSVCHIKVTRGANTHYTTPFVPVGLDYEFPGKANSVGYTKTTTQSMSWSITKSGGKSVKASILGEIFGFGGGGSYSFSTTDSGTQSIKVSDGQMRPGSDPFQNHNGDTFSLWINPAFNYWTRCSDSDHVVYGLSTDPTTPTLVDPMARTLMEALHQDVREVGVWDINAGSLLHPETLTDTRLVNFIKSLSASQIQQLLRMDPFYDSTTMAMIPSASLSSGRFVDIPGSNALYCPRNFSVAKDETRICSFDYASSQVHIDSKSASYNFSLGLKSPLGGLTFELTAGYSGTITTSQSSNVQSQYTIVGPASGQIAIDTLFGNYVLDMVR